MQMDVSFWFKGHYVVMPRCIEIESSHKSPFSKKIPKGLSVKSRAFCHKRSFFFSFFFLIFIFEECKTLLTVLQIFCLRRQGIRYIGLDRQFSWWRHQLHRMSSQFNLLEKHSDHFIVHILPKSNLSKSVLSC